MEVLLVRHAIAFERDAKRWRDDDLRPLSPKGITKFRKAAAGLKWLMEPPQEVWTSPLLRAQQTARILAEVAGWPKARERNELSPGGNSEAVIDLLRRASSARVALVGHEPALSQLAAVCLIGPDGPFSVEMKKGGVLALLFASTPRAGGATLRGLAPPRYLRAARFALPSRLIEVARHDE